MAIGKQSGSIGGVRLAVEADPERLKPPALKNTPTALKNTPTGNVSLHLANTVLAEMYVDIKVLRSKSPAVAAVNNNFSLPTQIPVPRRTNPMTCRNPAIKHVPMGTWSVCAPATSGDTTQLTVECDTRDDGQTFVDAGGADVDVHVE